MGDLDRANEFDQGQASTDSQGTVLLVDDDQTVLLAMRNQIISCNYQVFTADTASGALGLLQQYPVDILIADIYMPDISGIDLLRRALEFRPDLQCMFISGSGEMNTAQQALKLGAFNYLVKPLQTSELSLALAHGMERIRFIERIHQQNEWIEQLNDRVAGLTNQCRQITDRAAQKNALFMSLVERSQIGMIIVDERGMVKYHNRSAQSFFRERYESMLGQQLDIPDSSSNETVTTDICRINGQPGIGEMTIDGINWNGEQAYLLHIRDITDQTITLQSDPPPEAPNLPTDPPPRKEAVLESTGILNQATETLNENTLFLRDSFHDLSQLLGAYDLLLRAVESEQLSQPLIAELKQTRQELDLAYLEKQIPVAIDRSIDAIEQVLGAFGDSE